MNFSMIHMLNFCKSNSKFQCALVAWDVCVIMFIECKFARVCILLFPPNLNSRIFINLFFIFYYYSVFYLVSFFCYFYFLVFFFVSMSSGDEGVRELRTRQGTSSSNRAKECITTIPAAEAERSS